MISVLLSIVGPFENAGANDIEGILLNFLVQESLAHAALIFATLLAAFTFAAGFRRRIELGNRNTKDWSRNEVIVYGSILFSLFLVAIYAFLRFTFYAALADFLLNRAPPPMQENLTSYWMNVTSPVQGTNGWVAPFSGLYNFGILGLIISIFLAYLFAFLVTLTGSGYLSRVSIGRTVALVLTYTVLLEIAAKYLSNDGTIGYAVVPTLLLFIIWLGSCPGQLRGDFPRLHNRKIKSRLHRFVVVTLKQITSEFVMLVFIILVIVTGISEYSSSQTPGSYQIPFVSSSFFFSVTFLLIVIGFFFVYGLGGELYFITMKIRRSRTGS